MEVVLLNKKEYQTPKLEIVVLEDKDFIETSGELDFQSLWPDLGGSI